MQNEGKQLGVGGSCGVGGHLQKNSYGCGFSGSANKFLVKHSANNCKTAPMTWSSFLWSFNVLRQSWHPHPRGDCWTCAVNMRVFVSMCFLPRCQKIWSRKLKKSASNRKVSTSCYNLQHMT